MTPNPAYTLVIEALRGAVSERAAETMLTAALRDLNYSAGSVTPAQMQQVLSGPLLQRLSVVLPAFQARKELQALARRVAAAHPKAPTLFMDPAGPLDWNNVKVKVPAPAAHPAVPPTPAADIPATRIPATHTPAARIPAVQPPIPTGPEALLAADDFEFDDPDYSAFAGGARHYRLGEPQEQEALLSALARQPEVQGVVLCSQDGRVLRARTTGGADQLGSVVAATVMLFQKRALGLLCADLGSVKVCMRPLGRYCVAVLAGEHVNVGRLMSELRQLQDVG